MDLFLLLHCGDRWWINKAHFSTHHPCIQVVGQSRRREETRRNISRLSHLRGGSLLTFGFISYFIGEVVNILHRKKATAKESSAWLVTGGGVKEE